MTTHRKKLSALIGALLVAATPVSAFAGAATGGATLPEQIVQEGTLVEQLARQAQEVETQISQYENMVQNMVNLPGSLLGQIEQPVDQMIQVASQAQELATNAVNIANQFENLNPDLTPSADGMQTYINDYNNIYSALSNATDTAMQAANINPQNATTVAAAEQAANAALANPNSRNAILQAVGKLGQAEVAELGQLSQTVNAQTTLQASIEQKKLGKTAEQHEANQEAETAMYGSPGSNAPAVVTSGGTLNALSQVLGGNS